jgi:GLPGLI family protein
VAYIIVYDKFQNGQQIPNDSIYIKYKDKRSELSNSSKNESYFIDYQLNKAVKIINFDGKNYQVDSPFDPLPKAMFPNETESILGYKCNKLIYSVFSNTIEVWYTNEAPANGTPSLSYIPDGLVLKSVMNGNYTLQAKSLVKIQEPIQFNYPTNDAIKISESKYRSLQIKSRYTTKSVFSKEKINFEGDIENPREELSEYSYRYSKGTILLKRILLPEIKTGGNVFIQLTEWSNGDAYDRTGCVFTISDKKEKSILNALKNGLDELPVITDKKGEKYQGITITTNYSPPVELMRFFTPFGVGHFNDKRPIDGYTWADSVVYKQEITGLIPTDKKEIWIGVFIGNYDKGGHKVSLDLNYYPPFEENKVKENFILPLFSTLNVMEASGQNYGKIFKNDTLYLEFDIPEGIQDLKMLYTSTGHGGWENGDEFNPKLNRLYIDGTEVFKYVPWRTDCGTYRLSNPASGNFGNGMSSSDFSRSNWCPGTVTPPIHIPLNFLKPGKHELKLIIDQGDDEGSSFSHWSVSGILTGIKDSKN